MLSTVLFLPATKPGGSVFNYFQVEMFTHIIFSRTRTRKKVNHVARTTHSCRTFVARAARCLPHHKQLLEICRSQRLKRTPNAMMEGTRRSKTATMFWRMLTKVENNSELISDGKYIKNSHN